MDLSENQPQHQAEPHEELPATQLRPGLTFTKRETADCLQGHEEPEPNSEQNSEESSENSEQIAEQSPQSATPPSLAQQELTELLSPSLTEDTPYIPSGTFLSSGTRFRDTQVTSARAQSLRMVSRLHEDHRFHKETTWTLSRLKPIIDQDLLPELQVTTWFDIPLPIFFKKYVACLMYYFITHPLVLARHPLPITSEQKKAFKEANKILEEHLHPYMLADFNTRIRSAKSLLYSYKGM